MSDTSFFVARHSKQEKMHHLYMWMSAQEALSLIADIARTLLWRHHGNGPSHIAIVFSGIPFDEDKVSECLEAGLGVLVTEDSK